jgi:hypothetical protein
MVQFLSIIFFSLDFFNFCWVFQKFPFFSVTCMNTSQYLETAGGTNPAIHPEQTRYANLKSRNA